MPDLMLRPRIIYDTDETVEFSLPQKFWSPEEGAMVGDEDKSGAGIPVGYYVGWEYLVGVTMRFTDDEYDDVMAALRWIMQHKGSAFTWYFDTDDDASDFSVYLESPKLGERLKPTRSDPRTPELWELSLTLRTSNGAAISYAVPIQ